MGAEGKQSVTLKCPCARIVPSVISSTAPAMK